MTRDGRQPSVADDRLLEDVEALARISEPRGEGVNRVAFSAADREARGWVEAQMRDVGMTARRDLAGNSIGLYLGRGEAVSAIALGSHTDSVPNGGKYDGALGVVAALACVRALRDAGIRLRHPVEVINFNAEEATVAGGTFGSRAMAGLLDPAVVEQRAWDGRSVAENLADAGLDPTLVTEASRSKEELAGYLELHIEQGGVLESAGVSIGVVEGIVGIRRYQVTFHGSANHAGTTPMEGRRDALVLSAPYILAVRDAAVSRGIVGTVGSLEVQPGSSNVVPGQVELAAELRGLEEPTLDDAQEELRQLADRCGAEFSRVSCKPPAKSDDQLLNALESVCRDLDLTYLRLPSGAGHDAMCMAALTRQAMLFVPSVGGLSHSPDEFTKPESCIAGARTLLAALVAIDTTLSSE